MSCNIPYIYGCPQREYFTFPSQDKIQNHGATRRFPICMMMDRESQLARCAMRCRNELESAVAEAATRHLTIVYHYNADRDPMNNRPEEWAALCTAVFR
jgi:hypothetical protein